MNASGRLAEVEADITEAERLMAGLRLTIAVKGSIGEETTADDRRLLKMMQAWMLLQDERRKIFEDDLAQAASHSLLRETFLAANHARL